MTASPLSQAMEKTIGREERLILFKHERFMF